MIQFILNLGIILATIAAMEATSWVIHKYLFHGPLWFIHKTHHLPHSGYFELNDIFSLGFALLAINPLFGICNSEVHIVGFAIRHQQNSIIMFLTQITQ